MVVKIGSLVLMFFLIQSCKLDSNNESIKSLLKSDAHNTLILKKFYNQQPIAEIINQPIATQKDTSFTISKKTKLKIYCTGELDINWSTVPERYLFKGDDIEMFFRVGSIISSSLFNIKEINSQTDTIINEVSYQGGYDHALRKYIVKSTIPWKKILDNSPKEGDTVNFNLTVGDNDDKLKQKAKLVWQGIKDPRFDSNKVFGNIVLSDKTQLYTLTNNELSSIKRGSDKNFNWDLLTRSQVTNIIFGTINNPLDFSANIRSCWDSSNLYCLIEIYDSQPRIVDIEEVKKSASFHDYGLILDSKGNEVWRMNFGNSRHAGGAFKNRQIDTEIILPAGKYTVKYVTDESHSWNNWDDRPPEGIFYGIVIYEYK